MTKHYVCQSLSDVQQSALRRTSRESEPWAYLQPGTCLQPSTSLQPSTCLQPHPWSRTLTPPQVKPKPTLILIFETDELGFMYLLLLFGFPFSSDITFKHVAHQQVAGNKHKQLSSLSQDGDHNWAEII